MNYLEENLRFSFYEFWNGWKREKFQNICRIEKEKENFSNFVLSAVAIANKMLDIVLFIADFLD